jgi:hypothetical protein
MLWGFAYTCIPAGILYAVHKESFPTIIDRFIFEIIYFLTLQSILRKVFTKKYKNFELQTNFKKITWKFSSLFYIKILPLSLINYLAESFIFNSFVLYLIYILTTIGSALILKYSIEKNAIITIKKHIGP